MTQAAALSDTLEFGLFDWIEWDKSAPNEIFENRLRMLEYADRSGFYSYHLAEHHITPLSVSPSPAVFLAAAAQRTTNLRLGPLVFLLPFYNPIRLYHEICMLDNLSNGRLDLGVGRGVSPVEAAEFGVDLGISWEMFNEQMEMFTAEASPPGCSITRASTTTTRTSSCGLRPPEALSAAVVRQQQHRDGAVDGTARLQHLHRVRRQRRRQGPL